MALLSGLPVATRWGAVLTLIGLAVDIATHVGAGGGMPSGPAAVWGHAVTLGGMALALGGVLWLGFRPRTNGRRS